MARKSEQELRNEKSERILLGVALWASFYRSNPQRFVKDYLNVQLRTFQKFLIYAMMHNNHFMFWAARSIGKTWLTALFCIVRCILFPQTKICVASGTRIQANEVLAKIEDDFMKNYGWGSVNLCREITYHTVGTNKAEIHFANGSWIKVVTASDTGRGSRANLLILDEFRMIDRNTINTVLRRFMGNPRQPMYLSLPQYKNNEDLLETNIEIYMSSMWFKSHWSYEKAKAYTTNFLGGRDGYFICALPYQMAIKEGLKKRIEIEDEMSEADFDATMFSMEMECIPYGDTDENFFTFDDISARRTLEIPIYPPELSGRIRSLKMPELLLNERRILSIDIALMASKKHKNDASAIIINRAIPTNNNSYVANIVNIKDYEGLNTDDLALVVRRLYKQYHCTDLAIDVKGVGIGVYDKLVQDMVDPQTGELYPALSCCNNEDMADRCKVSNAPKVIWAINGSASFNTEVCLALRSGFQNGKINLLDSEFDCENSLVKNVTDYKKLSASEQLQYKMPFVQTTLLLYELIGLQHEINGTNVKLKEKAGARKDRYSSLAYNYWVQCQLERELLRQVDSVFDVNKYAEKMRGIIKAPIRY